ncbi:MAG: NAD(P)-dependent glycerol-3-phosphate dehydrogenase [Ruminococcaceae bacterium]|nr:NAD(P)-dependent glycerol-3-phosphate dehydrogenase [Oscillospiraceae bacterium]
MDNSIRKIKAAVLGTGSWASALAQTLIDNGHRVVMYGVDKSEIEDINANHRNSRYFGDTPLHEDMRATSDPAEAMDGAELVLITVPTRFVADALNTVKPYVRAGTMIVNASKGFDPNTDQRMSETIRRVLGDCAIKEVVSIIGPSHAEEVILRKTTAICAVSLDLDCARQVQQIFSNENLRLYINDDEIGAEYGVAMKNVIALASGMMAGMGIGDNGRAALVTRGIAEMTRYGMSKGGRQETYMGLTGIGDLVVTCFSPHSRNYQAGFIIGSDDSAERFFRENTRTVEGVYSCKVICEDAMKNDLLMPIISSVYDVLFNGVRPSDAVRELMNRPLTDERI